MNSILRKSTAALAAASIVVSMVAPLASVNAAMDSAAAEKLASLWVIVSQSNSADYRLGDSITRREMLKVMMNLSNVTVDDTCTGKFADLPSSDWGCKYAEAALANGMIAANANFRPDDQVSKIESLKMVMQGLGIEREENADWKAGYVNTAVAEGLVSNFSDYETAGSRGFIFSGAANGVEVEEETSMDDDLDLGWLFGDLDDDEDMEETDTTDETTSNEDDSNDSTPVYAEGDVLEVTLSPLTPSASTIPGAISGLPVAKFDFTAGEEDVNVTSLTLKRNGLSNSATLTALAVFSDEGRVSKAKNDSQENNTQAYITLDNGGIVVKAGSTMTLTVVADVAASNTTNGNEFAIELVAVEASSSVEGLDSLVAETMKVGWVDAPSVVIALDWSVADVKVGDEEAELFKFEIQGASDEDISLSQITFKWEGSIDEETELANYVLFANNDQIAEGTVNGKYVSFDANNFVIAEDKNVGFVVKADIIGGVTETIAFKIDKTLDVTAIGGKYGFGASVDITALDEADGDADTPANNELGVLTVDAWELTLIDFDAPSDKIRANKSDVVLGSVEINNISGAALELQKISVDVTLTEDWFIDDGKGTGTANDGIETVGQEDTGTLANVFESFEAVINGSTYELELNGAAFEDTNLSIVIPEGKSTMIIRTDTKEDVVDTEFTIAVTSVWGADMYFVETEEEEAVTDITPSTLSFKKLSFVDSGASVSKINLADSTVVRGASNIVLNQFEVTADEASSITIDEIKADLNVLDTTNGNAQVDFTAAASSPNKYVSEVALYKNSAIEANLLDKVSGSKITSAGLITFDSFEVDIAANSDQTFIITASIVDSTDVEDMKISADISASYVSAEDDDFDDVTVWGTSSSSKNVTVIGAGTLTVSADAQNDDNTDSKTLLWGESSVVYSADLVVNNESTDIETVKFAFNKDLKTVLASAKLYLNDTLVGTETSTNISNAAADNVAQVSTVTIWGTYEASDSFTATVNGTDYTFVADTSNADTATELAALIDANGDVSAAAVWSVITITADDKWTPFTLAVSKIDNGVDTTETITAATTTNPIGSILTFDNMTNLIAEEGESELRLEVTAESIGYQKIGTSTATSIEVTKVVISDAEWDNSGQVTTGTLDITDATTGSNTFAVVPATVLPAVTSQFGSEAKIKMVINDFNNTTSTNKAVTAEITKLTFTDLGNSDGNTATEDDYILYREDDSSVSIQANMSVSGIVSFDLSSFDNRFVTTDKTFVIKARGTVDETYALKLAKDGVTYKTNAGTTATVITTNLTQELDLGSKSY